MCEEGLDELLEQSRAALASCLLSVIEFTLRSSLRESQSFFRASGQARPTV